MRHMTLRRIAVSLFLVTAMASPCGYRITAPISSGMVSSSDHQPAARLTVNASSPLRILQAAFRPAYNRARDQVDSSLSPVVIVRFSDLYLVKEGVVIAKGKGIPSKYHRLHRTAHVPLVICVTLQPYFDEPLPKEISLELISYRKLADDAIPDLVNHGFTIKEVHWQEEVLRESVEFLDGLRADNLVTQSSFGEYRARILSPMMALADAAGAAQVDATHAVMSAWRDILSEDEWNRLKVIIVGFRQPRHEYTATQYFSALLPARRNSLFPGESQRVFYVESLDIDRNDLDFENERRAVATLLLDATASELIFNNPYRMSIDVMADGAGRRIAELEFDALR